MYIHIYTYMYTYTTHRYSMTFMRQQWQQKGRLHVGSKGKQKDTVGDSYVTARDSYVTSV